MVVLLEKQRAKIAVTTAMPHIVTLEEYQKNTFAWGLYTSVDVFHCNAAILSSEKSIREYVTGLCDLLKVKRYGDMQLILFGGDPPDPNIYGWSVSQMIETSLVSGHFIQAPRQAYVDIFSCKYYDPRLAIDFTVQFFQGTSFAYQCNVRGDRNAIPVKKSVRKRAVIMK